MISRLAVLLCLLLACSHVAATSVAGFRQLAITQNSLPHPKCVTKRVRRRTKADNHQPVILLTSATPAPQNRRVHVAKHAPSSKRPAVDRKSRNNQQPRVQLSTLIEAIGTI